MTFFSIGLRRLYNDLLNYFVPSFIFSTEPNKIWLLAYILLPLTNWILYNNGVKCRFCMQNKQDGFGRPRNCLSPLSATWKPRRRSRGDTSRCSAGLWGRAFDRGHTVTEWISSHQISCPYFLSGCILRGRPGYVQARARCTFLLLFRSRTNRNQWAQSEGSVAVFTLA